MSNSKKNIGWIISGCFLGAVALVLVLLNFVNLVCNSWVTHMIDSVVDATILLVISIIFAVAAILVFRKAAHDRKTILDSEMDSIVKGISWIISGCFLGAVALVLVLLNFANLVSNSLVTEIIDSWLAAVIFLIISIISAVAAIFAFRKVKPDLDD